MRPFRVEAEHFRSFEKLSWEILPSGLYLLDAKNHDTGGSNFSGKSNLLDSMFWCLYGWLPKWEGPKGGQADAVVMRGRNGCRVKVWLEHQGKQIEVERRRPLKVQLKVDGISREGKSSDLDVQIEHLVMSPQRFLLSVYMRQGRNGSFFSMGDTERSHLMTVLAGVENMDQAYDAAKQRRDKLRSDLDRKQGFLDGLKLTVEKLPDELRDAEVRLEQAIILERQHQDGLEADKNQLQNAKAVLADEAKKLRLKLELERDQIMLTLMAPVADLVLSRDELKQKIQGAPKVEASYLVALDEARQAFREGEVAYRIYQEGVKKNDRIRDSIEMLIKQADGQMSGNCTLCGQSLPDWDRAAKCQETLRTVESLESSIQDLGEEPSLGPLKAAVESAVSALATRKAQVEQEPAADRARLDIVVAQLAKLEAQQKTLRAEYGLKIDRGEISLRETILSPLELLVTNSDRAHRLSISCRDNVQREVDKLIQKIGQEVLRIEAAEAEVVDLNGKLDLELDLMDFFGPKGYRSVCFDGLVARIGDRAAELMMKMTNGIYSTRLEQSTEDSKGAQKVALRPSVTKSGIDVSKDDLSGGVLSRACLAYDISIAEAVDKDSPLFLDEALDGMDDVAKAEAIMLLSEVARTRLVVVVDHTNESKSLFPNLIRVNYRNGISSLEAA